MSNIIFLLSQYELLTHLAQHLSALDLFHLASTCSQLHTLILKSEPIFNRLKQVALCDGRGLKMRQEYGGIYALRATDFVWGKGRKAHYDEELEVRVWNLKCDSANALPCLKCNMNICDECRYVSRVRDRPSYRADRRPHHNSGWESRNVICYCAACDEKVERDLPLSISEYCDCDQYTRWICLTCKGKEEQQDTEYIVGRTKQDWGPPDDRDEGIYLLDHQCDTAYWCPCGERAPKGANIRCAWCKRRHNLNTWKDENPNKIPFFDEDPCYPKIVWTFGNDTMYPPLGYNGPIFQASV